MSNDKNAPSAAPAVDTRITSVSFRSAQRFKGGEQKSWRLGERDFGYAAQLTQLGIRFTNGGAPFDSFTVPIAACETIGHPVAAKAGES